MEKENTVHFSSTNSQNKKSGNFSKKRITLLIFLLVLIIGVPLAILTYVNNFSKSSERTWNVNSPFQALAKVATVGSETIYGDDLNYVLAKNYLKSTGNKTNEELKELALDIVAKESALLQAANDEGSIELTEEIFNNPNKNQIERKKKVEEIRDAIENNAEKFTTSAIAIWYYDMDKPFIPEVQARQIARTKITQYHSQIKAGEISMEEAGEAVKKDASLRKQDINYEGNAYVLNKDWNSDEPPFTFQTLNETALNLEEGQVSEVIEIIREKPLIEKFFIIIKMEKRQQGNNVVISEWTKDALERYPLNVN